MPTTDAAAEELLRQRFAADPLTLWSGLPDVADVVRVGDRRRRRTRASQVTAVTALIAAGITAVALVPQGSSRRAATIAAASPPAERQTGTPTEAQLHQAILDAYFPVTGLEVTRDFSQGISDFSRRLDAASAPGCVPDQQDPPHLNALPDLDFIAHHGLAGSPVRASTLPDPCLDELAAIATPESQVSRSASNEFDRTIYTDDGVLKVDADPTVRRQLATLGACAAERGLVAPTEAAFFALADTAGQAGDADRVANVGGVYALCMAPVVRARTALLNQVRDEWLSAHATEVRELTDAVRQAVDADIASSGVRWPPEDGR